MLKILYILLMINPTLLTQKLSGLVGFRNSYNPAYQKLDAANLKSRSGLVINDNPFVKIEFIYDTQDYEGIADTDFNNWVRDKLSTSIINVANAVFNEDDIIDNQVLYKTPINKMSLTPTATTNPEGNYTNTYILPPGFICKWIQFRNDEDETDCSNTSDQLSFTIPRVLLEFNGNYDGTETITLYLYNTSDFTKPVFSQEVFITGPIQEVILLDANNEPNGWTVNNTTGFFKGDYYLGYFSQGMTIQPFSRNYRDGSNMSPVKNLSIQRITFSSFVDPTAPIDLTMLNTPLVYDGVNPEIIVCEDYTNIIIQNQPKFARAIQLKAQVEFLGEIIASARSNKNQRISEQMMGQMMAQLEGQKGEGLMTVPGLRPSFYGAITSLKKEMEKLRSGMGVTPNAIYVNTLEG